MISLLFISVVFAFGAPVRHDFSGAALPPLAPGEVFVCWGTPQSREIIPYEYSPPVSAHYSFAPAVQASVPMQAAPQFYQTVRPMQSTFRQPMRGPQYRKQCGPNGCSMVRQW